ncbi:MAG: glycoside hydrolase family 44 protein [Janthinobacterium lividum]
MFSKRIVKIAAGLLLVVLVLLAGANVARRAVHGHGHWHQLATSLYHAVKGQSAQASALPTERADGPLVIYTDTLGDGWQDWSWGKKNFQSAGPVHSGKLAISLAPVSNRGIYLHHDAYGTGGYGTLQAFVSGDTSSKVCFVDSGGKFESTVPLSRYLKPDPSGRIGWQMVRIPLSDLGVPHGGEAITGIVFQPNINADTPLALDDISLLPDLSLPPAPTQATVAVTVNVAAGNHPISPYIYGMAFAPDDYLTDLKLAVNRWGGNDKSRYDWVQGNADNAARDWGFRNRFASDAGVPPGPSSAADRFVSGNKAKGAATVLTVPTIGWVARDSDNSHASANVPNSGGDPVSGADGAISGYDPSANRALTSVRSVARKNSPFSDMPTLAGGVVYQDEWIAHLKKTFGDASHGGVQFYAMDNEPDLWDSTHTDVHPARMGYDDVLHNFLDYASAVKAVDPSAYITGPASWGWTGYNYSALDRGDDNFHTFADRKRHRGDPFLLWFLKQVHTHDVQAGKRTLDVLDVHYYPQGSGIYGNGTDKATRELRERSTRSLWDPTYTDESWISEPIQLIPRLKNWIAAGYPGTRIGINEWSFGADADISGGLATADALGIFGRENIYLANYWAYPTKNAPSYLAFKLYRNADGAGHGFGDVSCAVTSADPNRLSCYAATDSRTGDLTMIFVNKMGKATITAPFTVHGATSAGPVKMWRVSADNSKEISIFPASPLKSALTLPPQSMTLLRVPLRK